METAMAKRDGLNVKMIDRLKEPGNTVTGAISIFMSARMAGAVGFSSIVASARTRCAA